MSPSERRVEVGALARVEGEGAFTVEIDGNEITRSELRIYEPPRFFESFLRGRSYTEPPDLTARICGICPIAYQTSAFNAIEALCGAEIPEPVARLRRLLYYGEWIESHTLHIHMLHAPDFLGVSGTVELAALDRPAVERGLQLKKTGNDLLDIVGGRAIHPVNVRIGGFYRAPLTRDLRELRPQLERAQQQADEVVDWVAGFTFPDLQLEHDLVALHHPDRYGIENGRLRSSDGLDIAADEFDAHFTEEHVVHSTALHGRRRDGGHYVVGPLARFGLNAEQLHPAAVEAARRVGLSPDERNPFRSIIVRAVEVLHATSTAIDEIDAYERPAAPAVDVSPRAGVGCGWSEAPRGMLWHRYQLDDDGTILDAVIVPPTAQNQPAIEDDLRNYVAANLALDDDRLRHGAEVVIRNHDPCISCATHFLDLTVVRR